MAMFKGTQLDFSFFFFSKLLEILVSQESSYFSHNPWEISHLENVPFGDISEKKVSGYDKHEISTER